MKIISYNGNNLLTSSDLNQNFEMDGNNLSFVPPTNEYDINVGVANNIFKALDSTLPRWHNTQMRYLSQNLNDKISEINEDSNSSDVEITSKYELYGLTRLGTVNLLYQSNIPDTNGNIDYIQVDLKNSYYSNSSSKLIGGYEPDYNLDVIMPKFNDNYEFINVKYDWYDSSMTERVFLPLTRTLQQTHAWTPPSHNDEAISGYMHSGWYIILPIRYRKGMQEDFSDILFTGSDGTSLLHHTILSVTTKQIDNVDVKYAYALIIIPYFFGYSQTEDLQYPPNTNGYNGNYGSTPSIKYYSNTSPQYLWMYYNNQYEPILENDRGIEEGKNGTYFYDTFNITEISEQKWKYDDPGEGATIQLGTTEIPQLQLNIQKNTTKKIYTTAYIPTLENASYDIIWDITKLKTEDKDNTNAYTELWLQNENGKEHVGLIFKTGKIYVKLITNNNTTYFDLGDGLNTDQYNSGEHNIYIRARVHANYKSLNMKGISFSRSETGLLWQEIITFIESQNYTNENNQTIAFQIDVNTLDKIGVGLETPNPLNFDVYFWIDFVLAQQHHTTVNQYNSFEDCFDFSDISPTFTPKNITSDKTYKVDNNSKTVQIELKSGSAIYGNGKWESPTLYLQKEEKNSNIIRGIQFSQDYGAITIETKILRHKYNSGDNTRATLYLGKDETKHFNIFHQKSADNNTNQVMGCITTINSKDTILGKQKGPITPTLTEINANEIWMRIICHLSLGKIIGEYSLNGLDWTTIGIDNITNYTDCHEAGITLANNGSGKGECNFEYLRVYNGVSITSNFNTEIQTYNSQNNIQKYPEFLIYHDSFADIPSITENKIIKRNYPYRSYICFGGTISLINNNNIYALKHKGNLKYNSNNIILFEDGLINYTAEFDLKIISLSKSSDRNNSINLWVLRGANDGNSYLSVSLNFKSNTTTTISLITYNMGESRWLTDEKLLKNNLETEKTYKITIEDNGQNVTVKIDEIIVLDNIQYITESKETITPLMIPAGYYKGFGANENNSASWTNIKIKPKKWYPEFFGKDNHFILPPGFIRNQPLHIEYQEYGNGSNQSKSVLPDMGGVFQIGPANLSQYTALLTRIKIEGTNQTEMNITNIDYQYTP